MINERELAKIRFISDLFERASGMVEMTKGQLRFGQSLMNCVDLNLYNGIVSHWDSECDPFYKDENVSSFVKKIYDLLDDHPELLERFGYVRPE
jgi:hypothetical protein